MCLMVDYCISWILSVFCGDLWFSRCVVCSFCNNTDNSVGTQTLISLASLTKKLSMLSQTFLAHTVSCFYNHCLIFLIADQHIIQSHVHTETWQPSTDQCLYYAGATEPLYSRDQIRSGGTVSTEGHIRVMPS